MGHSTTKPTNWPVRLAKTQIRLRSAWVSTQSDQSLLCAFWIAKDQNLVHADSKDWSDWANAQADLSLRWGRMSCCWFCRAAAQIYTGLGWGGQVLLFEPEHDKTYKITWTVDLAKTQISLYSLFFLRSATVAGESGLFSGVQLRHSALERNKRCLLAYLWVLTTSYWDRDLFESTDRCHHNCLYSFPIGVWGKMLHLIVSVPYHCLFIYLERKKRLLKTKLYGTLTEFLTMFLKLRFNKTNKVQNVLCKFQLDINVLYLVLFEPRHEKTCLMLHANNKDATQPVHPFIHCLDGRILQLSRPVWVIPGHTALNTCFYLTRLFFS